MEPDKPRPGAIVGGRFQLVAGLGAGSFGSVWRATDLTDQGIVAVKFLHPKLRRSKAIVERFVKEAEILGRLEHENLVRIVDWQVERRRIFLALEFVQGSSLAEEVIARAKAGNGFTKPELQVIVTQMCAAVHHAHSKNVVHRDLKPANVMLPTAEDQPRVKVLDFGIAKTFDESASRMTTVGRILGTRSYLAPEQILGVTIDHRADVFALGTIFFELVTMRRAWLRDGDNLCVAPHLAGNHAKDNTHLAVLRRIQKTARPRASDYAELLPAEVDNVLHKAMAIDPEVRFDDADELRRAFLSALDATYHASASLPIIPPLNTASVSAMSPLDDEHAPTPAIVDFASSAHAAPEELLPPKERLAITRTIEPATPTPTQPPTSTRPDLARPLDDSAGFTRTPTGPHTKTTTRAWAVVAIGIAAAFAAAVFFIARPEDPVVAYKPVEREPTVREVTVPSVSPLENGTPDAGPSPRVEDPPPPPPGRTKTKRISKRRPPPVEEPPPTGVLTPAAAAAKQLRRRLDAVGSDDGAAARRAKLCADIDAAAETHLEEGPARRVRRCTALARLAQDATQAMADLRRCLTILSQ